MTSIALVRVAAYQAPLLPSGSMDALPLIRQRIDECEANGVSVLCCPEAILGGLADHAADPASVAIATREIERRLSPLASAVTTIVGLTEITPSGLLYNTAAVVREGHVIGVYRKHHPAIRRSVYEPGCDAPVFHTDALTFGIIVCNDSNFHEPAHTITTRGATVIFVPANNALPHERTGPDLLARTHKVDVARAIDSRVWVVRADVSGNADSLVSYGSSAIVAPGGEVMRRAMEPGEQLLIADIGA